MNYRTKSLIEYWLKAGHRKGHGIHSPFLYKLISSVIENDGYFSAYKKLDDAKAFLQFTLRAEKIGKQDIPDLPLKYGKLIFRLVNEFLPEKITFYGETFGLNLLCLALADQRISVNATIRDKTQTNISNSLLKHCGTNNIVVNNNSQIVGDFILINHPNEIKKTESILSGYLQNPGNDDVVIVCGIHQSKEAEELWDNFKKEDKVRVSLDLFEIGITLFRQKLQKENFILKY